ncbi:MAG: dTDP-4-dehydrorhamnose reductase [Bacteroidota bacterium]
MRRVLITGTNGLLGQKLAGLFGRDTTYELLLTSKHPDSAFDHAQLDYTPLDITAKREVRDLVLSFRPDLIINAAAFTAVDSCETQRDLGWRVNVTGVENLIDAVKRVGAKIIQISSDYVFDGKSGPYDENARPNPLNYYGKTKLASENALRVSELPYVVIRTMILYGTGRRIKQNFALRLLELLQKRMPITVADDQVGCPTLVDDLAYGIVKVVERDKEGIYHISGSELISRYDFAVKLADVFELDASCLKAEKTARLKQIAERPLMSGFITLKAESELGLRTMSAQQGLQMLKSQVNHLQRKHIVHR